MVSDKTTQCLNFVHSKNVYFFSACNILSMFCSHSNPGFMHTELKYVGSEMNVYRARHLNSDIIDSLSQAHSQLIVDFWGLTSTHYCNIKSTNMCFSKVSHMKINFYCHLHKIQNYCGDRHVGVIKRVFPERLKEKGRPSLNTGQGIPQAIILD